MIPNFVQDKLSQLTAKKENKEKEKKEKQEGSRTSNHYFQFLREQATGSSDAQSKQKDSSPSNLLKAANNNRLLKYNKIFPSFKDMKYGDTGSKGIANFEEGNPQSASQDSRHYYQETNNYLRADMKQSESTFENARSYAMSHISANSAGHDVMNIRDEAKGHYRANDPHHYAQSVRDRATRFQIFLKKRNSSKCSHCNIVSCDLD